MRSYLHNYFFPYNSLYTQAVAYTTYFVLGKPVRRTGTQNTKWWLDYTAQHYTEKCRESFLLWPIFDRNFNLQMDKSFNSSFNFMFFHDPRRSVSIRVDPTWSDPDWRSGPTFVPASINLPGLARALLTWLEKSILCSKWKREIERKRHTFTSLKLAGNLKTLFDFPNVHSLKYCFH